MSELIDDLADAEMEVANAAYYMAVARVIGAGAADWDPPAPDRFTAAVDRHGEVVERFDAHIERVRAGLAGLAGRLSPVHPQPRKMEFDLRMLVERLRDRVDRLDGRDWRNNARMLDRILRRFAPKLFRWANRLNETHVAAGGPPGDPP